MSEHVQVLLQDRDFDRLVHSGLPEGGDLTIAVKERATKEGRAGVVVAFSVRLPDGSIGHAQAVTTLRNFLTAAAAIRGYAKRVGQSEAE